ncbi:MAG: tetratricopeptide repeat protein [Gammaproteobacteria bacterium]|nr:tetratricopeptide repeat protein [Gammaproteobacteria bacterium]
MLKAMLNKVTRIIGVLFFNVMLTACALQVQESASHIDTENKIRLSSYYAEAVSAAKNGLIDKAIELFETVVHESHDFGDAYTYLGLQHLQKNDLDKADRAFEKAILLDSTNFVAYNHRGVILRNRGDFSAANMMYQAAIKYNPDYANAHFNIAILYDIYLYDLEKALYHYRTFQALSGESDKLVEKWIIDLERQIVTASKDNV